MPIKQNTQEHQSILGDRQDGSSSLVHRAIVSSGRLGEIPPYYLIPFWALLFILTYRLWHNSFLILVASIGTLCFDWVILELLPVKNRSWGPVTPPLLGLTTVRIGLRIMCGLLVLKPWNVIISLFIDAVICLLTYYATWIEPFHVKITRVKLQLPACYISQEIKMLHISDIHYEGLSLREEELIEIIKKESPDVIFLTGDYLSLSSVFDDTSHCGVKQLLGQFNAPLGVYAVPGSPAVDHKGIVPEIFNGLSIQWLQDTALQLPINGKKLWIIGIVNTYDENRDIQALKQIITQLPGDSFSILLYHTPDLMPAAIDLNIGLYLCGHTHGGQISVPFYGALVTSSKYGKRFERGLYHTKNTRLYVSRGLGMEGMGAPRARLCSPPEVIVWSLVLNTENPSTTMCSILDTQL